MTDPITDQKRAQLRDLRRLRELMHPYVTSGSEDFYDALPRMPEEQRLEALGLIRATATWDEPAETTQARQDALLRLAEYEAVTREVLVRSPGLADQVRAILSELERDRARLAGLPPASGPGESTS